MAHLMAPKPGLSELPVFFNVEGVVGAPPAQNMREDVLLVQFIFDTIAKNPIATTNPELLAAAKAVQVTGVIDAATINAIKVMQATSNNKSAVKDGRVSPAQSGYSYGIALWTIVQLNNALQGRNVDIWPRIDKIPGCPTELVQMVTRTVAGV